jgi:hypothetical protein
MGDQDKPTGPLGKAPTPSMRGDPDPLWMEDADSQSGREPLGADDDPDDPDTLLRENRGPARGIVVGLAPALLVWVVLIAVVRKLL